jgi:hypothetical protein
MSSYRLSHGRAVGQVRKRKIDLQDKHRIPLFGGTDCGQQIGPADGSANDKRFPHALLPPMTAPK